MPRPRRPAIAGIDTLEGIMRYQLLRWTPFVLAGFLLLSLTTAIIDGGRGNWLMVALVALAIAANLWARDRTTPGTPPRSP